MGNLDFIVSNLSLNDFYIKKQLYDLVFEDVDVFFEKNKLINKHYKLKSKSPLIKKCTLLINGVVTPIEIDYSILL